MVTPGAIAVTSLVAGSASETSDPKQSLARLLQSTARDLSVMGASLANGGVNPRTDERVVDPETCHATLAVMTTAGLYETSGDSFYDIGLPRSLGLDIFASEPEHA